MPRPLPVFLLVLSAAGALAFASAAYALVLTPKATITFGGSTYTFSGGRCRPILDGFRLQTAGFTSPRYFSLQESASLANGVHHGAALGVHVGSKYYTTGKATVTLKNHGKAGTFSGKWDSRSGGGSFRGSFSC